jgi:hypothetical protein
MMDLKASLCLNTWKKHQRRNRQLFCQLEECRLMHLVGKTKGLDKLWAN